MDFRILGVIQVLESKESLRLGGPKQRAVLAHLILRANRPVSASLLIDQIWGEASPPAVKSSLQSYVSHLRNALGPDRLEGRSGAYVLHAAPEEIDALRFEALVARARQLAPTDAAAAVLLYEEAGALSRGPVLEDLDDQPSLRPEITRLEELRMAATEERLDAELNLGRHAELIPEMETLAARHPLRERLWGSLMIGLYRSGRQGDALAAFHRAREVLAEELGIDPSPKLRRLHEQILRQDPALDAAGEPLRGYRLLEQVGAGSFGSVHRAFQPQVGREVAVKTIHPRFANDPEFIRRFEGEAQLVARLEHPHVVPLYDFWREPKGAYLVMRYLRGGSLRDRLAHGALAPHDAAGLLDQVVLALGAAHRQGVVHRDVKPANILFDEDDNAYVTDFGIAKDLEVAGVAVPGGTPSPLAYYVSPEEVRGEPVTPRTDIYSLGVVLHEVLTGRHPFAETPPEEVIHKHLREPLPPIRRFRRDLSGEVDRVIARATAKNPAERFPDVHGLAAAFRAALVPAAVRPVPVAAPDVPNPYKGLRPFVEADAPDFFGRESLVAELVARLSDRGSGSRFLAVVGPSGSGKSSVVRASLVPALRRGAVAGSDRWFFVEMHPGAHPFEELAAALMRIAVHPSSDLVQRLERDDEGLLSVTADILSPGSELLLVVDQFEEAFTLIDDEDVRAAFLRVLVGAVAHPDSRVRVVVTLRADFYDRPLSYGGLAELMKAQTATVTPLVPEELERAVSGPAERVGVAVDPALVAEIVADVAAQPGSLPLLQYALTELFERRSNSTLTLEAYRKIGGVSGALLRRAEGLYRRLNHAGQEATRQLFLRLLALGREGTDDTRRRVLRSELTSLEVDGEAVDAVIDTFGARRLLSFDRDQATREPTVEVAHEALLREWDRLRGWIERAREHLRSHRRIVAAAREWIESGRDPSFLLRGIQLARFEAWTESAGLALTRVERGYLDASFEQQRRERAEEDSRKAHEAALERRSLVRLRALVAVLAALVLVASVLTAFAINQRRGAQRDARLATAREFAAAAVANLDVDPERSILLALEAVDVTWETDRTVVPEAEEALHRALKTSRVVLTVPEGGGLGVSPDGTRFGTTGDGTATVWGTQTGERLLTLRGHEGPVGDIAFSPDGRELATAGQDGTVRLWDAASGRQVAVLRGHAGPAWGLAFSPDGRWLATAGEDANVRVWDVAARTEELVLYGVGGDVFYEIGPAFSPDGSLLAISSRDNTASIFDLATTEIVAVLTGHAWDVSGVAFSPDGIHVATTALDGTARIWDVRSGAPRTTLSGHTGQVHALAYSADGSRIVTGGTDATARVWDAKTGKQLLTLSGHTTGVDQVAFTPDGDRLLTAAEDGTTRLWDVSVAGGRDWLTVPGPYLRLGGVEFSPDGRTFAVPGELDGVTIRDVDSGREVVTLKGHDATITPLAFSPDGTRLAAAAGSGATDRSANQTVPVWDVRTGELVMTLSGHRGQAAAVAFSPDGRYLATGGWDRIVRLWDAETGEELRIRGMGGEIFVLGFSPDGRSLVVGAGADEEEAPKIVSVLETTTLEPRSEFGGHSGSIQDVAFASDRLAVTADHEGNAKMWDLSSGRELLNLQAHTGPVQSVAVSPDGTRIATASDDGTAKLWDAATGREVLTLFGHNRIVHSVAFSPDGRLLATASGDGTVALHLLPIDELRELARERVTRTFTDEECRRYLRMQSCPAA